MTYGNNQYTFSTKTTIGFKNIAINAKTDKEAFAIVADRIGPDDHILGFSTERCLSTAKIIHDDLNCEYSNGDGVLEGAEFLFRATPQQWEDMIIDRFDLGIGEDACWLDEPVTYEMLDNEISDFIIDKCVKFFHSEDRVFCMIDFTYINDGCYFTFPDGENITTYVIDDWCWDGEDMTDADFLDYFDSKIRATLNSFLARFRA